MIRRTLEWVLGTPWVFERLRRWVLGGFDFGPAYSYLDVRETDIVLDVGCGMGDAMEHLDSFSEYHGFDIDARAIDTFRRRCSKANVHLYARRGEAQDIARIAPSRVVMVGVLHHMSDAEVVSLLRPLTGIAALPRIATVDTVFIPGSAINNLLARFERGRYVRTVEQYQALVRSAGLDIQQSFWIDTGRRVARYYGMVLKPLSNATSHTV
jgi:2-polyprenyl-3-methyl-5-hydroxy-6-metoxy-1,4-benzoquinol methylase